LKQQQQQQGQGQSPQNNISITIRKEEEQDDDEALFASSYFTMHIIDRIYYIIIMESIIIKRVDVILWNPINGFPNNNPFRNISAWPVNAAKIMIPAFHGNWVILPMSKGLSERSGQFECVIHYGSFEYNTTGLTLLVLEDDFVVTNMETLLASSVHLVPSDWDVIRWDCSWHSTPPLPHFETYPFSWKATNTYYLRGLSTQE